MAKFKQGDIVQSTSKLKVIVLVTYGLPKYQGVFPGVVIQSDPESSYKIGEDSKTWHESGFELAPKGLLIQLTT